MHILFKNISLCFIALLLSFQVFSQDKGTPALQPLALFTSGGAAAGAVLGAAWWLTDPLNPSSDIKNSTFTGLGLGSLVGLILGIYQLVQTAIVLGAEPIPPDEILEGNNFHFYDPTLFPKSQVTQQYDFKTILFELKF